MRFHASAASKGQMSLIDEKTGMEIASGQIGYTSGKVAAPEQQWIKLLENLSYIQQRTQIPVSFPPDGSINNIIARDISELAELLKTGKVTFRLPGLKLGCPRESTEKIIQTFPSDGKGVLKLCIEDETVNFWGATITIGSSIVFHYHLKLADGEIARLKKDLEDANKAVFEVFFKFTDETPSQKFALNWLPAEEAQIIQKQFTV
jgi:hypothetical protein